MYSIKQMFKIGNGPSSSHTIGPSSACRIFKKRYPQADFFKCALYGSLGLTGKGHFTDLAIINTFKPIKSEVIFDVKNKNIEHINTMDLWAYKNKKEIGYIRVFSIGGGNIVIKGEEVPDKHIYEHNNMEDILKFCDQRKISLLQYVKQREDKDIYEYFQEVWRAMQDSIETGLNATSRIPGPINYTRKAKMILKGENKGLLSDTQKLLAYGIAVSETNASRGIVVTGPTCGSTGIIPAVMRYAKEKFKLSDNQIIDALLVGGIVGNIIRTNGSIAGAEGGCQAECGSGCAMAAAAYSYLLGLNNRKITYAAKFALEHHLGLTCDPILGYVLVPCISRNGVMACRAVESATLSALVDENKQTFNFDQMVKVMKQTGLDIPQGYKETSISGLAKQYKEIK